MILKNVYTSETGRSIEIQLKENIRAFKNGKLKSRLVQLVFDTGLQSIFRTFVNFEK